MWKPSGICAPMSHNWLFTGLPFVRIASVNTGLPSFMVYC